MIFSFRIFTTSMVISLIACICTGQDICSSSCTQAVLDTVTCSWGECYKCGDRINFLMSPDGGSKTEYEACFQIAVTEFPEACGPCNPVICNPTPTQSPGNAPSPASSPNYQMCGVDSCTQAVLDTVACSWGECYKCGDRINFLMSPDGGSKTEYEACFQIAVTEFSEICGLCNPDLCNPTPTQSPDNAPSPVSSPNYQMCGVDSCTQAVLDTVACSGGECYKCGERIDYVISLGVSEIEACLQVGNEFPTICGPCIPEGLTYAPTASVPPPNNSTLIWSDEFSVDGEPNPELWGYDVGGGGWGNGELQYYTDRLDNAFVSDGVLNIRAVRENYGGREYTSARLTSKNKGDFKYGRFQFRARLRQCTATGSWSALWMLPTDWLYGGWPDSGEIDVMEHVGYDTGRVHGTVHTKAFNHMIGTQVGDSIITSVEDWHVYDIIWDEDKVDFIIDGIKYHEFLNKNEGFEEWPFNERFHIIMNVAVGGSWGGVQGVDSNAFDGDGQIMEVDWVRVYSESSTISPTISQTSSPTISQTSSPTISQTSSPTISQTSNPTISPTSSPTISQTSSPTISQTSNPTISPTSSPTILPTGSPVESPSSLCFQNEDDHFLLKGSRSRTCNWLSKQSENKVEKICLKRTVFSHDHKPAEIVCEKTCDSCDECFENYTGRSYFFLKFAKNENPIYKQCKWLKKGKRAKKHCGRVESNDGRGPPREVCPKTCHDVTLCPIS